MKFYLLLILGAGATYAIVGPTYTCTCDSDSVLYQLALSGPTDDALCHFGCLFHSCVKKCKLPGDVDLQQALDAKCGSGARGGGTDDDGGAGGCTGGDAGSGTGPGGGRGAGGGTCATRSTVVVPALCSLLPIVLHVL